MFSHINIAAICTIFFTTNAFADADDSAYRRLQQAEYRNAYDENYGAGYARSMQFNPSHRPLNTPPVNYVGYQQSMPRYDQRNMESRQDHDGR